MPNMTPGSILLLREATCNTNTRRQVTPARTGWFVIYYLVKQHAVVTAKRAFTCKQLKQNYAKRINIGAPVSGMRFTTRLSLAKEEPQMLSGEHGILLQPLLQLGIQICTYMAAGTQRLRAACAIHRAKTPSTLLAGTRRSF